VRRAALLALVAIAGCKSKRAHGPDAMVLGPGVSDPEIASGDYRGWWKYESADFGFSALFPRPPEVTPGKSTVSYIDPVQHRLYMCGSLGGRELEGEISLERAQTVILGWVNGTPLGSRPARAVDLRGLPGREVHFRRDDPRLAAASEKILHGKLRTFIHPRGIIFFAVGVEADDDVILSRRLDLFLDMFDVHE